MKTALKNSAVQQSEAALQECSPGTGCAPSAKVETLVREMIGQVADKWTMLIIEELTEHGVVRFTRLGELVGGISQKMLTKTLRQLEEDGLVKRTVHPVIPPHVDYQLTHLGESLSEAFCGIWKWAEQYHMEVAQARQAFADAAERQLDGARQQKSQI